MIETIASVLIFVTLVLLLARENAKDYEGREYVAGYWRKAS